MCDALTLCVRTNPTPLHAPATASHATPCQVLDGLGLVSHVDQCGGLRLKQVHAEMKEQGERRKTCWKKLLADDFPFHIRNNNPLHQYVTLAHELYALPCFMCDV
jgi:hypothetical protein